MRIQGIRRFNEAGAIEPRKRFVSGAGGEAARPRFNEAGAIEPRKLQDDTLGHTESEQLQ